MTDTTDYRLRVGHRVECCKQGPFDGKRGKVQGRIGQCLVVEFDTATLTEKATYFEKV